MFLPAGAMQDMLPGPGTARSIWAASPVAGALAGARGSAVLLTRQNLIVDERLDKHRAPLVRREAGAVGGGRCYQGQKQEHSVVVVGEELGQSGTMVRWYKEPWYPGPPTVGIPRIPSLEVLLASGAAARGAAVCGPRKNSCRSPGEA